MDINTFQYKKNTQGSDKQELQDQGGIHTGTYLNYNFLEKILKQIWQNDSMWKMCVVSTQLFNISYFVYMPKTIYISKSVNN